MCINVYKTIVTAPEKPVDAEARVPAKMKESHEVESGHRALEGLGTIFTVLTFVAVAVASLISIYPILNVERYVHHNEKVAPWTPLELAGRDIYVREGCYTCHSQQIRKLSFDVVRFGKASTIEESRWDRPFQWGSKRIGPDLARVGKKYPHLWHFRHMIDPRAIVEKSIMPSYWWLVNHDTDFFGLRKKISVLKGLGVPYEEDVVANPDIIAQKEAKILADALAAEGAPKGLEKTEIVALIAYLQALGQKGEAANNPDGTETKQ